MVYDVGDLLQGAQMGSADIIREAITAGVSPDAPGRGGMTALHFLSAEGHADCVHILLEAGADINIRDDNGRTPLHHAAAAGRIEVLRLLLHFKAQVDVMDKQKWTPLGLALGENREECVYSLSAEGAQAALVEKHHAGVMRTAGTASIRALLDGERCSNSGALAKLVATNPERRMRKTSL